MEINGSLGQEISMSLSGKRTSQGMDNEDEEISDSIEPSQKRLRSHLNSRSCGLEPDSAVLKSEGGVREVTALHPSALSVNNGADMLHCFRPHLNNSFPLRSSNCETSNKVERGIGTTAAHVGDVNIQAHPVPEQVDDGQQARELSTHELNGRQKAQADEIGKDISHQHVISEWHVGESSGTSQLKETAQTAMMALAQLPVHTVLSIVEQTISSRSLEINHDVYANFLEQLGLVQPLKVDTRKHYVAKELDIVADVPAPVSVPVQNIAMMSPETSSGPVSSQDDCVMIPPPATSHSGPAKHLGTNGAQVPTLVEIADDDDDDDVQVVAASGHVPLKDWPHQRDTCGVHPFTRGLHGESTEENKNYCSNCFCYVCDWPASACDKWASPKGQHCNADPRDKIWQNARASVMAEQQFLRQRLLQGFAKDGAHLKQSLQGLKEALATLEKEEVHRAEDDMYDEDDEEDCGCDCHNRWLEDADCFCDCVAGPRRHKLCDVEEVVEVSVDEMVRLVKQNESGSALALLEMVTMTLIGKASLIDKYGYTDVLFNRVATKWIYVLLQMDITVLAREKALQVLNSLPNKSSVKRIDAIFREARAAAVEGWENRQLLEVLAGTKEEYVEQPALFEIRLKVLKRAKKWEEAYRYLHAVRFSDVDGRRPHIPSSMGSWKVRLLCKQGLYLDACDAVREGCIPKDNKQWHVLWKALQEDVDKGLILGLEIAAHHSVSSPVVKALVDFICTSLKKTFPQQHSARVSAKEVDDPSSQPAEKDKDKETDDSYWLSGNWSKSNGPRLKVCSSFSSERPCLPGGRGECKWHQIHQDHFRLCDGEHRCLKCGATRHKSDVCEAVQSRGGLSLGIRESREKRDEALLALVECPSMCQLAAAAVAKLVADEGSHKKPAETWDMLSSVVDRLGDSSAAAYVRMHFLLASFKERVKAVPANILEAVVRPLQEHGHCLPALRLSVDFVMKSLLKCQYTSVHVAFADSLKRFRCQVVNALPWVGMKASPEAEHAGLAGEIILSKEVGRFWRMACSLFRQMERTRRREAMDMRRLLVEHQVALCKNLCHHDLDRAAVDAAWFLAWFESGQDVAENKQVPSLSVLNARELEDPLTAMAAVAANEDSLQRVWVEEAADFDDDFGHGFAARPYQRLGPRGDHPMPARIGIEFSRAGDVFMKLVPFVSLENCLRLAERCLALNSLGRTELMMLVKALCLRPEDETDELVLRAALHALEPSTPGKLPRWYGAVQAEDLLERAQKIGNDQLAEQLAVSSFRAMPSLTAFRRIRIGVISANGGFAGGGAKVWHESPQRKEMLQQLEKTPSAEANRYVAGNQESGLKLTELKIYMRCLEGEGSCLEESYSLLRNGYSETWDLLLKALKICLDCVSQGEPRMEEVRWIIGKMMSLWIVGNFGDCQLSRALCDVASIDKELSLAAARTWLQKLEQHYLHITVHANRRDEFRDRILCLQKVYKAVYPETLVEEWIPILSETVHKFRNKPAVCRMLMDKELTLNATIHLHPRKGVVPPPQVKGIQPTIQTFIPPTSRPSISADPHVPGGQSIPSAGEGSSGAVRDSRFVSASGPGTEPPLGLGLGLGSASGSGVGLGPASASEHGGELASGSGPSLGPVSGSSPGVEPASGLGPGIDLASGSRPGLEPRSACGAASSTGGVSGSRLASGAGVGSASGSGMDLDSNLNLHAETTFIPPTDSSDPFPTTALGRVAEYWPELFSSQNLKTVPAANSNSVPMSSMVRYPPLGDISASTAAASRPITGPGSGPHSSGLQAEASGSTSVSGLDALARAEVQIAAIWNPVGGDSRTHGGPKGLGPLMGAPTQDERGTNIPTNLPANIHRNVSYVRESEDDSEEESEGDLEGEDFEDGSEDSLEDSSE